jgi:hypothetical protein
MQINTRMILPRNQSSVNTYMSCSVELGPNQVCTLFGASAGSTTVSGRDYIKAGYHLDVDDLWRRNFIVIVGFLVLFALTQAFVIELVPVSMISILLLVSLTIPLRAEICRWRWYWLLCEGYNRNEEAQRGAEDA